MNYEQKYKEALGWMQSLYKGLHGITKEDAEHYFPELKESEDDKIRKEIHIYLDWLDGRKDYQPKGVYTIRDMIDWVIKQDKKISADKVIEWLNHHELSRDDVVTSVIPDDSPTSVPHRVKWLSDEFIKQFKKDFGI